MDISQNGTLAELRNTFAQLTVPSPDKLAGAWEGKYIGPFWLRTFAPLAMGLGPLRGWSGKRFIDNQNAINIVGMGQQQQDKHPMTISKSNGLDTLPVIALKYDKTLPFPLPRLTDEIRMVRDDCLMGMAVLDIPLLRKVGWPFILTRKPGS
tara:strand:+ start:228 stop:683 length:456 start_codon:yes stop_codon:yes gene_type:complete